MTKKNRATRTRAAIIQAAAEEFECDGYTGVSLGRVSHAAGVSNGALTFHFSSKAALADAVVDRALVAAQASVGDALSATRTPIARLSNVVSSMARTLHENGAVRAAARLELDRSVGLRSWSSSWHPLLRRLAEDASRAGELPAGTRPEDVTALASLFIRAIALHTLVHPGPPGDSWYRGESPMSLAQFLRLWAIVRHGFESEGGRPRPALESDQAAIERRSGCRWTS